MDNKLFEDFYDELESEDLNTSDNEDTDVKSYNRKLYIKIDIPKNVYHYNNKTKKFDDMTDEQHAAKVNLITKKINYMVSNLNVIYNYAITSTFYVYGRLTGSGFCDDLYEGICIEDVYEKMLSIGVHKKDKFADKKIDYIINISFNAKEKTKYSQFVSDIISIRNMMIPFMDYSNNITIYFSDDEQQYNKYLYLYKDKIQSESELKSIYSFITGNDANKEDVLGKFKKSIINYSKRHSIRVLRNVGDYKMSSKFDIEMEGFGLISPSDRKTYRYEGFLLNTKPIEGKNNEYTTDNIIDFIINKIIKRYTLYDLENTYADNEAGCVDIFYVKVTDDLIENSDNNTDCWLKDFEYRNYCAAFKENRYPSEVDELYYQIVFIDKDDNIMTGKLIIEPVRPFNFISMRKQWERLKDSF